jgi:hypothetical protein
VVSVVVATIIVWLGVVALTFIAGFVLHVAWYIFLLGWDWASR